uniref:Nfat activating molecule with ITAM motif 1 n=1 Tax=Mus musculus TaxID=10090 RepID=A0A2U3TZ64_MOUSE
MESWLLRRGARVRCLHPPSWLPAWCFLCLLPVPQTLQLTAAESRTSQDFKEICLLSCFIRISMAGDAGRSRLTANTDLAWRTIPGIAWLNSARQTHQPQAFTTS